MVLAAGRLAGRAPVAGGRPSRPAAAAAAPPPGLLPLLRGRASPRCRAVHTAAQPAAQEGEQAPRVRAQVFHYLHFSIRQDLCAQKVGTDAMLLGAWAPPARAASDGAPEARVLDVGTGTGVLALMAAQKAPPGARVDAIDLDPAAAAQAAANAAASRWAARVRVARASLQEWVGAARAEGRLGAYDAIASNPPYFTRSSKPERCARRAAARHADVGLPFEDLAAGCAALLRPGGALCLVLPPPEAREFLGRAAAEGLALEAAVRVFTRAGDAAPKRLLLRLEKQPGGGGGGGGGGDGADAAGDRAPRGAGAQLPPLEALCRSPVGSLVIRRPKAEGSGFTEQYVELTKDFHHPDFFKP
ncbi:hypothetical protein Rsub_11528 [Raphidocelis subcapitata]|uniref:Methyltransferase small domain-containing protein n=1 Tax=Raphidocelis subcapitata TaxID=307507 RepID=A0A2V0PLZ7_9CHLO|nr:hypothetical protein Rsub_11528 [Raphidocelis subcapitata]|eukprot:GBF98890.1 hypothetical protein Rsub_11528 [Raphidocelis subcapitata]